jgi:hypothetical protein
LLPSAFCFLFFHPSALIPHPYLIILPVLSQRVLLKKSVNGFVVGLLSS